VVESPELGADEFTLRVDVGRAGEVEEATVFALRADGVGGEASVRGVDGQRGGGRVDP
jgi:hypothetical protein